MAGRHYSLSPVNSKNSKSIAILFIVSITLLFSILSLFSSPSSSSFNISNTQYSSSVDYSFTSSLEKFLTTKANLNKVVEEKRGGDNDNDGIIVKKLDNSIWERENEMIYNKDSIFPVSLPIKVYVYDMPSKFTYDLLWLFHNSYRDTFNLTSNGSPVHRLIEQHSIDYWLWADLIAPESERALKNLVVRVDRQEAADLFYIPFFTTISFFLLEKQQCKALYRVKR